MTLWFRFLLRQLTSTFAFLLLAIFGLYLLVDLSINGVRFLDKGGATLFDTLTYYLSLFSYHFDLFASLALLLSSFRVLAEVNGRNELVSLLMAGISKRQLKQPFLALALSLVCLSYINSEWILPHARDEALAYTRSYNPKKKKQKPTPLFSQSLSDESTLVYQRFDQSDNHLIDVFWIRSPSDIWYIFDLDLSTSPPIGHFVDHFIREPLLTKESSASDRPFPEFPQELTQTLGHFRPIESRPLSTLIGEALSSLPERAIHLSQLQHKLARPLFSPLFLFALLPSILLFSRTKRLIVPLAFSLAGWVAFLLIQDGILIMSENQLIPSWSLWIPLVLLAAASYLTTHKESC